MQTKVCLRCLKAVPWDPGHWYARPNPRYKDWCKECIDNSEAGRALASVREMKRHPRMDNEDDLNLLFAGKKERYAKQRKEDGFEALDEILGLKF